MLIEEIISDGIQIDHTYNQKFFAIISKWASLLSDQYNYDSYNQAEKTLSKMLYPLVYNVIRPYYKPVTRSFERYGTVIPAEQISGYRVSINLTSHPDVGGSAKTYWRPIKVKKGQYTMHNEMAIGVTREDFNQLANSQAYHKDIINNMVDAIMHELTHLIQGLKSSELSTRGKVYVKTNADAGSTYEIEAYAQSFVSNLIQSGADAKLIKIILSSGLTSFFGRDLIPTSSALEKYRALKKYPKVWNRFQKKVYEKLAAYLNQQPNI